MLDKKILKLRKKLNDSILNECEYEEVYKISVELDEAIWEYYCKSKSLST